MKIILNTHRVKIILAHKNRSFTWLAVQINTTPQYISALMAGKKHPSPDTRGRIQKILNGYKWDDIFIIKGLNEDETSRNS